MRGAFELIVVLFVLVMLAYFAVEILEPHRECTFPAFVRGYGRPAILNMQVITPAGNLLIVPSHFYQPPTGSYITIHETCGNWTNSCTYYVEE